ncbi:MAG: WYL domain-containing protein [Rhodocyclaceae bacterium]|nr:WYL domain-containing protein [Rhodocyclaceae bacterium]
MPLYTGKNIQGYTMARRSDTLETTILAIELLRRIPRGRKITASELHQQLKEAGIERELRTIQRQLDVLSKHFEIERDDRSRPYGYSWLAGSKGLAVPRLTPQESLLLGLAERHLQSLLPARLRRSMQGFFDQARLNLGLEDNARREKEWADKVRVVATSQPLLPPKVDPAVFETVSEALYLNHWLQLDYGNANGKRIRSEVMPLGLAQQGTRLYLVCRFLDYDNERILALNRIVSARMLPRTFGKPKNFDLARYDGDGHFGFGEGRRVRLEFRITESAGLHLLESPLSSDQKSTRADDGRLRITATVVDSAMLDRWLRGFGKAVTDVRKTPVDRSS